MTFNTFRFEWHDGQWYLLDPHNNSNRVAIDTALIDCVYCSFEGGVGRAEGYIVSMHGLPQEVAQFLDAGTLRDLGVGAQMRPQGRPKARRGQLGRNGRLDWQTSR